MADPLLQYYTDETWGYDRYDEKEKLQAGIEIAEEQQPEESRGDFFDRIGKKPRKHQYGRYLDYDEDAALSGDWEIRYNIASEGMCLDKLVDDEDARVREAVAEHGYRLAKLIKDESWRVRAEVARQGYGLDKLLHDKSWKVRLAVAEQGYRLDKLEDDENIDVRRVVERQLGPNYRFEMSLRHGFYSGGSLSISDLL